LLELVLGNEGSEQCDSGIEPCTGIIVIEDIFEYLRRFFIAKIQKPVRIASSKVMISPNGMT